MALGILRNVKAAFTNLNPDKVRASAHRELQIGLAADSEEAYASMEDALLPAGSEERWRGLGQLSRANGKIATVPDLVFYEPGVPAPSYGFTLHAGDLARTVDEVLDARPELELALAHQFPPFRDCVIERIIKRTARENALFSVVTALPDFVPSLIELPWAVGEFASDTAFLTINQVRMSFEIAGASGKDIGYQHQKAEIAAIIASAFGWRAIARQLAGKIPLGGGMIIKGAIAYAGTYAVGRGLESVMRFGRKHSNGERRDLFDKAYDVGKAVSHSLTASLRRPVA
ncbi:MAG TPA: hypothetical protein DEQ47_00450 [Solibacterales bacterium]|nr:hypothetical protein [Bryobacterales bacterium]